MSFLINIIINEPKGKVGKEIKRNNHSKYKNLTKIEQVKRDLINR